MSHWQIGENYFIRTVTMYQVGRLKYIDDKELVLEDASWVADTGCFENAFKKGSFSEVEHFQDDIIVNRTAIIDAVRWRHELPKVR